MDFDAVRSYYQPAGWEPHEVVAKADFDACHAELIVTRKLVEIIHDNGRVTSWELDKWSYEARTELAQEGKEHSLRKRNQ